MAEPDESSIANVSEFTGLDPVIDRELIVAALKDKTGSVEAVVAAFYDDEARFRQNYLWDETPFFGDRDGTSDNATLPTFNIQGPDESNVIHGVSPSGLHPGAPSRPPSRAQSPLGRIIDWTAQNATAGAPTSKAQEDTELQRALAESAAMSRIHSPQETGVTTSDTATNLPFFGPANRETYDPNQWAMVRTAPENLEPGPSGRRREPGTPAFLRYRKDKPNLYNLNAILTILHAIPGVRNALLRSGTSSANYGQNPEWWKGTFIPSVGDAAPGGTPPPDNNPEQRPGTARQFSDEIHRLMAFLDGTDRAYGTADGFGDNELIEESWDDDLDRTFFAFFQANNPTEISGKLFTQVGVVSVDELDSCPSSNSYAILDARIDKNQYCGELRDVYNVMDSIYWADLTSTPFEAVDSSKMALAGSLGQIQIFKINIDGLDRPLEVPEFFYADRYIGEHRQLALQIQMQLRSVCQALEESKEIHRKITTITHYPNNTQLDRSLLSEQAIGVGLQKFWQLKAASFWKRYEESIGTPKEFDFSLAGVETAELSTPDELGMAKAIQAEMVVHNKALSDINKRLQKLNVEKEACERLLDRLRIRYTGPSVAEDWAPTHRYSLRGVIASTNTYYFCQRQSESGEDDSLSWEDQWWRVSCNAVGSQPWSVEKTKLEVAQEEAFKETGKPTLIYASDEALDETPVPLSDALRTFVRFDNRLFKQELLEESPRERKRLPAETPTSPSKRQQRSNSIDSIATNRASVDECSDRDMSDVPLVNERFVVDETFGDVFTGDVPERGERTNGPLDKDLSSNSSQDAARESSIGTEMVQLAISNPGHMSPARPAGVEETGRVLNFNGSWADKNNTSGHGSTLDGSSSRNDSAGEYRYNNGLDEQYVHERQGQQAAHGRMQMIADWDNPEGRYVEKTDTVKEQL